MSIGDRPDYYAIGDMPMRWFDKNRWPKIIKLLILLPFMLCVSPWILFWNLLDMSRDVWRDL